MTSAWAHLPNAAHIDRVIASVLSNPVQWTETWVMVHGFGRVPEYNAAWDAAHDILKEHGRYTEWTESWVMVHGFEREAWSKAWYAARDAVRGAAWGAILALIAYDDCAHMLDSDPGELAILAAFGDPRAILLLYACKVFHSIKEVV